MPSLVDERREVILYYLRVLMICSPGYLGFLWNLGLISSWGEMAWNAASLFFGVCLGACFREIQNART